VGCCVILIFAYYGAIVRQINGGFQPGRHGWIPFAVRIKQHCEYTSEIPLYPSSIASHRERRHEARTVHSPRPGP